jgi:hypothetical protein
LFLWKTGVTERGALADRTLVLEREHRIWRPFAYTILEDLQNHYRDRDEPLCERLYQSLSGGDQLRKITRRGRFHELDARLVEECASRFVGVEPLVVHDAAASNGITSLELFELLQRRRRVELHATDYYDRLYLVTLSEGRWTVAFDVDRQPLQAIGGRWVLSLRDPPPWRYPVNRWLLRRVRGGVLPRAAAALEHYLERDGKALRDDTRQVRVVSLFHPKCVERAARDAAFHCGRHDLFQPGAVRAHVIRALNVLTTKHLPPRRVLRGIEQLAGSLAPDGLLVLGRSLDEEDGRLRATVYTVKDSHLFQVCALDAGYEDADLALQARVEGDTVPASSIVQLHPSSPSGAE